MQVWRKSLKKVDRFIHSLIGPAVILSIVITSLGHNLASSADSTLNEWECSKTSRELGGSETANRTLEYMAKISTGYISYSSSCINPGLRSAQHNVHSLSQKHFKVNVNAFISTCHWHIFLHYISNILRSIKERG